MNSIPYEFCHHVIQYFRFRRDEFTEYSLKLTNPWSDAALSLLKHSRFVYIQINQVSKDLWAYGFFQAETPPLEVIMRMDTRYVRFGYVSLGSGISNMDKCRSISSQDLRTKLIPFVASQMTQNAVFSHNTDETGDGILDVIGKYGQFEDLRLRYGNQVTENFLRNQMNQKLGLRRLTLIGDWPESEALLIQFVKSPNFENLDLCQSGLRTTFPIFKTLFDLWISTSLKHKATVRGLSGIDQAQIVGYGSQFCIVSYCSSSYVQWKCENSTFRCVFSDCVVIVVQ